MDRVEVIELSLHDWIAFRFTFPRLNAVNMAIYVTMVIQGVYLIPLDLLTRPLRYFPFIDQCLSIISDFLYLPVGLLVSSIFFFIILVASMANIVIWSSNMFITGVIGPIIGLTRELLGYPSIIRLR